MRPRKAAFKWLLLAIVVLAGNVLQLHATSFSGSRSTVEARFCLKSHDFSGSETTQHPFPSDTEPGPESPELYDGCEELQDDWNQADCQTTPSEYIRLGKVRSALLNYILELQNRASVPLFVLHHSWRDFLS